MHDLVVVDHQHAQLAVARRRSAIRPGLTSGTVKWHRQSHSPGARLALAELDDAAGLQRLERRQPQAHARCWPRPPADAVVDDLEHERVVVVRSSATSTVRRARRACARCAPPRRAPTARAARARRGTCDALGAASSASPRSRVLAAQPVDLLERASCCVSRRERPERALERARAGRPARPAARRAMRSRALGAQLGLARERERHAEQPLDDALVDLAREVDALLQLRARWPACWSRARAQRGERGDLAERPQQVALGVAQRRAAGPRSERITPSQRPAAAIGVHDERALAQQRRGTRSGSSSATALRRPRSRGPPRAPRARSARSRPSRARRRRRRASMP